MNEEVKLELENKKEELKTEVTSIAKEELKTGTKIDIPTPDELMKRSSISYITLINVLSKEFSKLGGRAKERVFNAIMALPQDGEPVKLVDQTERELYAIGQRALVDRFTITYYHVLEEQKKHKEKLEQQKDENKENKVND